MQDSLQESKSSLSIIFCIAAQVAAGACHSLAVTRPSGRLYTWGWSAHGQCGTGSTSDIQQPALCGALDGVPLAAAAAGMAHSVVASRDGAVYSFGWNSNSQLGLVSRHQQDHSQSSLLPRLVEDPQLDVEHVVKVRSQTPTAASAVKCMWFA